MHEAAAASRGARLLNRHPLESYSAYLDGHCLTDAEVEGLRRWIAASEKNATEFIEFAILHAAVTERLRLGRLLDDLASHRSGGGITASLVAEAIREIETNSPRVILPLPSQEPTLQGQSLWQILVPVAAIAAVLMLAAWGFWQTAEEVALPAEKPIAAVPPAPKPEPPRVAARLSTSFNAQWADDATVTAGREFLEGSQLHLVSGVIKLEMLGGAAVVIEGPSQFRLPGPDSLQLERGKAAVRIAEGGNSFVLDTPTMHVIDLGTEFGVESFDGGDDQVMVFDGSVALATAQQAAPTGEAAAASQNLQVGAGFQVSIESDEQLRDGAVQPEVLTNPRYFFRPDEIDVRLRALAGSAADKKLAAHYERQRLAGLLAYQGFDAASGGQEFAIGLNGSGLDAQAIVKFVAEGESKRGGIDVESGPVFMVLDTSPTGPFAGARLVNDIGLIGRSDSELWLTWRARRIRANADNPGSAGVSLMFGDRNDFDEPVFLGRGFGEDETLVVQTAWGKARPPQGERITTAVDFVPSEAGVQSRIVDDEEHAWLVRIQFRDGADAVSLWIDADLETLDPEQPQAVLDGVDVEFDRIRMAVNRGDEVWRFSEFAAGLSPQALHKLAHVAEFQVDQ
jgi:hypothetical protein